jgi:hypothetical protein
MIDLSHSPHASAWVWEAMTIQETVSTVSKAHVEDCAAAGKTVETVVRTRRVLIPRLKPGVNETLQS